MKDRNIKNVGNCRLYLSNGEYIDPGEDKDVDEGVMAHTDTGKKCEVLVTEFGGQRNDLY